MATMSQNLENALEITLKGIKAPHRKQKEILRALMCGHDAGLRKVDLVCGRGFGKSLLCILASLGMLSKGPEQCGLFLEPDWGTVKKTFLRLWREIVPRDLWRQNKNDHVIQLINGAQLFYGPRNMQGNKEDARDKYRGGNYTFCVDDEAAMRFDKQQYTNTALAVRVKQIPRFYLTATTPKIGPYKDLVTSPGHILFKGTSFDNPHLPPNYVEDLMADMSRDQIRREIYAEFIALEGRIWREVDLDSPWPKGNTHYGHNKFNKDMPFWLMCDLGSATASYVVVQRVPAVQFGEQIFKGNVWVAVADLCPYHDASAVRAFDIIDETFGRPAAITAGKDVNTRNSVTGKSVAHAAMQVWPNIKIIPTAEAYEDRQIQYDRLSFAICSGDGNRRFCVAKDFVEIEPEGRRGVKQMLEEDVWPDEPSSATEFLPKQAGIMIQHTRDALLNGAVSIMAPPRWGYRSERTK